MIRPRSMEDNWQESSSLPQTLTEEDDSQQGSLSKNTEDLFELLEKLQNNRLDDQRCVLPASLQIPLLLNKDCASGFSCDAEVSSNDSEQLRKIVSSGGPQAMVVLPTSGGFRLDAGENWSRPDTQAPFLHFLTQTDAALLELDGNATLYRRHFYRKEHYNFIIKDPCIGPVVMSMKYETFNGVEHIRVILRLKHEIISDIIPTTYEMEPMRALKIAKKLCKDICCDKFSAVLFPRATNLIMAFDEHVLMNKLKFGVVYQKCGQVTEEEMFGNETHSPALDEFMQLISDKVDLKNFEGFRGGLDTAECLTGSHSYYTTFEDVEIMFHVATFLPLSKTDPQQLQRKRHIGNDVVSIIFQEENSTFMPSMIASNFLHAYIVVQPIEPLTPNTRYKISITTREDVPYFGPALPSPPILAKNEDTRRFIIAKLINAEVASMKAKRFASLERRTRHSLLHALYNTLYDSTLDFCGFTQPKPPTTKSDTLLSGTTGFFDSVRKALSGRNRSQSVESHIATPKRSSSRASNNSLTSATPHISEIPSSSHRPPSSLITEYPTSIPIHFPSKLGYHRQSETPLSHSSTPPSLQTTLCESDSSSMNSLELEKTPVIEDSGMESMSSGDAPQLNSLLLPLAPRHKHGIISGLSIFASFAALHNVNASIWGVFTAVYAALVLRLHLSYRRHSLHLHYTPAGLLYIRYGGIILSLISIIATVVYIVLAVVLHQGYKLENDGYAPASIFAVLSLKWTIMLYYFAGKYGKVLTEYDIIEDEAMCSNNE